MSNSNQEKEILLTRKKYLLKAASKIMGLKRTQEGRKAIEILRNNPVCNKQVIAKYGNMKKDPDPLSTTMANISMKYPLLCKKEWAMKHKDPRYFLLKDNKLVEDSRTVKFVKCSREAIRFYLNEDAVPDPDQMKAINVLYKQQRDLASSYNEVDWSKLRLKMEEPELGRKKVSTRQPIMEIAPDLRRKAIALLLVPDFVTDYGEIPKSTLYEMKKMMGNSISVGIELTAQYRILLNTLDQRRRTLPTLGSLTPKELQHSIAKFSSRWIMEGNMMRIEEKDQANHAIYETCQVIYYLMKTQIQDQTERSKMIRSVRISKTLLVDLVQNVAVKPIYPVKCVKAVMGLPVEEITIMGKTTFYPKGTFMPFYPMTNLDGSVKWNEYYQSERIGFTRELLRGTFIHTGDMLDEVMCNWFGAAEFTNLLADIGAYIRWGWKESKNMDKRRLENDTREFLRKSPWRILSLSAKVYKRFIEDVEKAIRDGQNTRDVDIKGFATRIVIQKEVEIKSAESAKYDLTKQCNLVKGGSTERLMRGEFSGPPEKPRSLPANVESNFWALYPFLHFKLSFEKTLGYLTVTTDLNALVASERFNYFNLHCENWLRERDRGEVASMARQILEEIIDDKSIPKIYKAYLYMFSRSTTLVRQGKSTFFIGETNKFDLFCTEGQFKYEDAEFTIFGRSAGASHMAEQKYRDLLDDWLVGFRLQTILYEDTTARETFINGKMKLKNKLNGASVPVQIGNEVYLLIKDDSRAKRQKLTIKRQLERAEHDEENFELDKQFAAFTSKRLKMD